MTKRKKHQIEMNPVMVSMLDEHIAELGLPLRTENALTDCGITTVDELLHCCPLRRGDCDRGPRGALADQGPRGGWPCDNKHLMDIANFGEKMLKEVRDCLRNVGFE